MPRVEPLAREELSEFEEFFTDLSGETQTIIYRDSSEQYTMSGIGVAGVATITIGVSTL